VPQGSNCPECISSNDNNDNKELASFPILSNELFTFHYSAKSGVELEFKPRRRRIEEVFCLFLVKLPV